MNDESRNQFLEWLASRHPDVYSRITGNPNGLGGDSAAATESPVTATNKQQKTWVDNLTSALPILAQTYRESKIIKINLARAKQNLPPLDDSVTATKVNVQHSVGGFDTRMLMVGLGVGILWMLRPRR